MRKAYVYNEKLKYARELRGWSQEELARRVGCLADTIGRQGVVLDVSTISRWERGRNSPSPFYRQLLCSLFEMNAEELGLLAPDNPPQLSEEASIQQEFASPENTPDKPALPLIEAYEAAAYDIHIPVLARQEDTVKDLEAIEIPSAKPEPYFLFARRRDFLAALLASVTLGGGAAIIVKLFLSRSRSGTSTGAATPTISKTTTAVAPKASATASRLARRWPKVTPDLHKKLARVRVIQWMLNARGWNVQIDGVFWVETENAVMFFQENKHLPVTNTVSNTTWERLILLSGATGSQGDQVRALQEILNMYGTSPHLDIDGDFGPLTEAATRHFQQAHRLTITGQADLNTWCVLVGGSLG